MICTYCKNDAKATREHIIPKSIIDLFPECEYVFDRKGDETKVYKAESVIRDVCADCNNGELSKLDNYGFQFISKYFIKEYDKDDTLSIEYDYNIISRWLLKIIFNCERSSKNKTFKKTLWFEENIDYILGRKSEPQYFISIFGGMFVNSSPMPLFWANNIQLDIIPEPQLLLGGLLTSDDPMGRTVKINKEEKDIKLNNLYLKYLIKFGTGMFLVLMWNEQAESETIQIYEKFINEMFPYKLLDKNISNTTIERCTHPFNIISTQIIDSYLGMHFADETNCFMPLDSDPIQVQKELNIGWEDYVKSVRLKKLEEKKKQ